MSERAASSRVLTAAPAAGGRATTRCTPPTTTRSGVGRCATSERCTSCSASRASSRGSPGSRSCASVRRSARRSPGSTQRRSLPSMRATWRACSTTPASCVTAARSPPPSPTPQRCSPCVARARRSPTWCGRTRRRSSVVRRTIDEIPASTPESTALAKALRVGACASSARPPSTPSCSRPASSAAGACASSAHDRLRLHAVGRPGRRPLGGLLAPRLGGRDCGEARARPALALLATIVNTSWRVCSANRRSDLTEAPFELTGPHGLFRLSSSARSHCDVVLGREAVGVARQGCPSACPPTSSPQVSRACSNRRSRAASSVLIVISDRSIVNCGGDAPRAARSGEVRRYLVMPTRSRPKAAMALPRISWYVSSSESPAVAQISVATFLESGKVESAWG